MGKAKPGYCEVCQRGVNGNNWSRHIWSKAHIIKSKGNVIKKKFIKSHVLPTRGRPRNDKLHKLDT
jgi:hypothetical protein